MSKTLVLVAGLNVSYSRYDMMNKESTRIVKQRQQQRWPGKDSNKDGQVKTAQINICHLKTVLSVFFLGTECSQVPLLSGKTRCRNFFFFFFCVIFFTKRSTEIGTTQSFTSI